MIEIFRKIWLFAGEEQKNIRNSILVGFLNAIFHMLQIGAIFLTIQALVEKDTKNTIIWYVLGLMIVSIAVKLSQIIFPSFNRHMQDILWPLIKGYLLETE